MPPRQGYGAATWPPPPPAARGIPVPPPPPPAAAPAIPMAPPAGYAAPVRPGSAVANQAYVGLGPRLAAKLIDAVLLLVLALALSLVLSVSPASVNQATIAGMYGLYALITLAYNVLLEAGGGTLGRRVTGTRVVSAEDGGKPGLGRALVRNLMHMVDALPLLYLAGILAIATSERKQRLGDRVAGTYVVRR